MESLQEVQGSERRCPQALMSIDSARATSRKHWHELRRETSSLEEQLSVLRKESDGLRQMLFEAAQMQRRLCGPRHMRRGAFEISGEIFPVRHVSGDFISVSEAGDDVVLVLGDISGKGLSAGMWFPYLLATIRRYLQTKSPDAALTAINRELCCAQLPVPMTTLFLASLNVTSGRIRYCNAGHPPALLLRRDAEAETLDKGGPILGVVPEAVFVGGEALLEPGDSLLAYSDGILECRNAAGAEFGLARVIAAARASDSSSAPGTLFSVLGATEDFGEHQQRDDDMALLVVQRDEQSLDA
jgi:serine phosphatase RsbU (regulator of sigma subunit)